MIITDGTHLVSTVSAEELHEFAFKKLDLDLSDFHGTSSQPHYKMGSVVIYGRARHAGAKRVSNLDLTRMAWWSQYKARQVAT